MNLISAVKLVNEIFTNQLSNDRNKGSLLNVYCMYNDIYDIYVLRLPFAHFTLRKKLFLSRRGFRFKRFVNRSSAFQQLLLGIPFLKTFMMTRSHCRDLRSIEDKSIRFWIHSCLRGMSMHC